MSVRGVTAQELLENQDPDFLYTVNEVTGERTPLVAPAPEKPKRKAPQPKKEAPVDVEPATPADAEPEPATEGDGE